MSSDKINNKKLKLAEIILAAYPVLGLIVAIVLKLYWVKRYYYTLAAMVLVFVLLILIADRRLDKLHIREFAVRYWQLTATAILCVLYQALRVHRSHRTLLSGFILYFLIYSGFLYGKKFGVIPGKIRQLLAVLLGVASAVGIFWWIMGIFPPEQISIDAARYFYSAPHRMVSVFVHPIIAAYFMLLLVAIAIFSFGITGNILDYTIRYILLFLGIAGIYATSTRSSYLILIALPIVWYLFQRQVRRGQTATGTTSHNVTAQSDTVTKRKILAILIILVVFLVLFFITGAAATVYNRFFGVDWREDPSYTFRIDAMKVVIDNIFGRGIGRFLFGMGAGKGDNLLPATKWIAEKYEVIPAIDNSYATMFLEQGIFAFIMFIYELIIVIKNCLIPRTTRNATENSMIYFLLLPQLIMALTFDAQTWPGTEFILFVMIGIEMAGRSYPHPGFNKKHPLIINGRIFAQNVTGVQRYGIEIIKQIDKVVEPGEVILALPHGELQTKPEFTNIEAVTIGKGNGNKWTQIYLPIFAYKKRGTILTLAGIAPAIKPDYVATHDISFMRYPESYGKAFRTMYRYGYLLTLYRCKGIITISGFSKNELINFYQLSEDRFTIAGNSAEQLLETPYTEQGLTKWGIRDGEPYYLSVGSKNLHKNQKFIKKLAAKYPDKKFVVAGGSSERSFGASGEMEGSDQNLILTGYISDDDLRTLYVHAHAFIFPSLYEGFGIPPMEAILSGVKHIALADIPVLREIYTKGCYFFNPKNVDAFDIEALDEEKENITDEVRTFYIRTYSWKNSAKKIIAAIK